MTNETFWLSNNKKENKFTTENKNLERLIVQFTYYNDIQNFIKTGPAVWAVKHA